jgi:methionine-rich copper-binding protein CopC
MRPARSSLAAAFLLVIAVLVPRNAGAHAIVVESTPAVGAEMPADFEARLRFNSRIDAQRSRLALIDAKGAEIAVPLTSDLPPDILGARVSGLERGAWKLRWQVLAIDGHITRGDISFRVGP